MILVILHLLSKVSSDMNVNKKRFITGGIEFYDQIENPSTLPPEKNPVGFVNHIENMPEEKYIKRIRNKPIITGDPES